MLYLWRTTSSKKLYERKYKTSSSGSRGCDAVISNEASVSAGEIKRELSQEPTERVELKADSVSESPTVVKEVENDVCKETSSKTLALGSNSNQSSSEATSCFRKSAFVGNRI